MIILKNNFDTSFRTILHGRRKYKPYSFVYRFQALNLNSVDISGLLIVMGKPIRNIIGHRLFTIEPIGNLFYLLAEIFEIQK